MNFWQDLPRPFFVLAPMEDVTDTVFRRIVAQVGKPDVFITEFTHVDAILHDAAMGRLEYTDSERPIVAQIWGNNPESFREAAKIIQRLGFDGIDINMGCPVRDIVKQGGCSALIGNHTLAQEIIAATKEVGLPISVKTRIGKKQIITEDWIGFLLTQQLAAITIHGRTAAEMSKVPAHWDEIAKAVNLRNNYMKRDLPVDKSPGSFHIPRVETLVIGNGDVKSLAEANDKVKQYGVDGVMVGRGIFENIALFSGKELTQEQKYELLKSHIRLYDQTWKGTKRFELLKKFVKAYISGFAGAAEVRQKLMQATSSQELLGMLS